MTSPSEASDELSRLRTLVSTLQQENALLRQKIDALARRIFSSSSEKAGPAQLELLLQLAPETSSQPLPRHWHKRRSPPQRLVRKENVRRVCPTIYPWSRK